MKYIYKVLIAGLFFVSSNALAIPLTGAGDFSINGTTVADRPELAGLVLEDLITDFSFIGTGGQVLSGQIQNRVVRSTVDGTLDFYWRIFTDATNNANIEAFRVGGFDGFALDADWRIDGLGDAAPDIARNFDYGSVNFLFESDPVTPGIAPSSNFFFLDTQATSYAMTGQFDLLCADSGCMSQLYSTFAPAQVPEPTTLLLFGSGMLAFSGMIRRRKKV